MFVIEQLTSAYMPLLDFLHSADLSIFQRRSEQRATDIPVRSRAANARLSNLLDDSPVTEETSLRLSAVYSAVNLIANHLASLPFDVLQIQGNRTLKANDTAIATLLRRRPNRYTTAYTFQKTWFLFYLLWGNGYARIRRSPVTFRPTRLELLHPANVRPFVEKGSKYYHLADTGENLFDSDVLHIMNLSLNGLEGLSVIQQQRVNLSTGQYAQRFGSDFFKKGAHVGGTIEVPDQLQDDAFNRLQEEYRQFEGETAAHKIMMLEGGAKYNRIGIPPEDAQFIETRKFTNAEIARMFNVPPHKIGVMDAATFSNIEHQSMEYVQDCLLPIAENAEQEITWKLFFKKEQGRWKVNKNFDELLRGDIQTRKDYYQTMFNIGAFSQNDILTREGENPIEGGDRHFVQANNLVPLDRIDDYLDLKRNQNTQ
jgi:HK97 family phage portal protein